MTRRRLRIDRATATIAIGALVLGLAYMGIATWVNSRFADTVPSTSTLSTSATGLKVWHDYLERLGTKPQLLTRFDSLPASSTIVFAGGFEKPPTEAEAARVEKWVRAGGRAVFVGLEDGGLLQPFDPPAADVSGEESSQVAPTFPGAYASGIERIAAGSGRLDAADSAWVTLYSDASGASVVARTVGKGQVVWLADVTPVSNDGIGRADDAKLAVQLVNVPGNAIYFDEYHHGLTNELTAWGLLGTGGRAGLLLLGAAALALLVALGRRRGPAIARIEAPAARGGAYIGQLAELFRTAGARAEALASIEDAVARALVRRYGDRASGLARRPAVAAALSESAALRARGAITRDEFVAAARRLRAARQEVEDGNG